MKSIGSHEKPINGGFSHRAHFSVLITGSIWFLLFLLFIQIMIHIQSNTLKTLIDILKDATEGNLSKFVKRHVFSEEVVSVRFLQESGEGAGTLFQRSPWYLNPVGHLLPEPGKSGHLSVPAVRLLYVSANTFPL